MAILFTNLAASTLAAEVTSNSQTSLTLATGQGALFPNPTGSDVFYLVLDDGTNSEIVKCTARSTDTLTVVRGQEGTTAQASFAIGTRAELRLTAAGMTGKAENAEVVHLTGNESIAGIKTFSGTTDSTSTTTGTVVVGGGIGAGGAVNSVLGSVKGTTATDLPTYGSELLTDTSGWTTTGWTGSSRADGWTHTSGNTSVLSESTAAVAGTKYQIAYTITGRTAGSITLSFGGESISAISATDAWGPTATSTAGLTITPTSDFNGKIVISVKAITASSTSIYNVYNSSGTIRLETRATSATDNTCIGIASGGYITTGQSNTLFGYGPGTQLTTATNCTGIGYRALYSTTVGSNNTAIGHYSMRSNVSGTYNTTTGVISLYSNTSGSYNSAHGYRALFANSTGSNNSAFGSYALHSATGSNNVAIGYSAGRYATGSSSFYVDNQDRTNTAGDKAGALLYGTFNATPASQTLTINAATTVSNTTASTSTTTGALKVAGGIGAAGDIYAANLASSALTSGRVAFVTTGGRLIDSSGLKYSSNLLTVGSGVDSSALIVFDGAVASQRGIQFKTSDVDRWILDTDTVAESGGNAGCAIQLRARDDAGNAIDTPVSIVRASGGLCTIVRPVSITSTTASTSTTTGALTVSGGLGVAGAGYFGSSIYSASYLVPHIAAAAETYTPAAAGTATLDCSKGNKHFIQMPAGNVTIAISNVALNQCLLIRIKQDSTGSRTVTWFSTISWAGGSAPTLTTTANKTDIIGIMRTGADTYDGFVIAQNI